MKHTLASRKSSWSNPGLAFSNLAGAGMASVLRQVISRTAEGQDRGSSYKYAEPISLWPATPLFPMPYDFLKNKL